MSKRKISCLPCRLKKLRCSGGKPCERCQSKHIECTFASPGQVGRPPKNAVVNKIVRTRPDSRVYQKFIFEHASTLSPSRYLQDSKTQGLADYLKRIYTTYFIPKPNIHMEQQRQGHSLKKKHTRAERNAADLIQYFPWMSADISAIMMRRLSSLQLTQSSCFEIVSVSLNEDISNSFFDLPSKALVLSNPLNSLASHHAVALIDNFFYIHPYSIMFNKSMLLQAYWTDTTDPLLFSVIYGTTIFMSRIMDGKPHVLWPVDSPEMRNPFLDHAHLLLSKLSAEVTMSRYQGVVLLGLFEVTFGFAKKGVSLFALSYMIAGKLGLFNDTLPLGLTPTEKELLLTTYWSAFQCTIRGCVELEQIPRHVLCYRAFPYPPMNSMLSLSVQSDTENGNLRSYKHANHIVETFYVQCVVSQLCCDILRALPQEESKDSVDQELKKVLGTFYEFIEKQRQQLSKLQEFTLEVFYSFYTICLDFLEESVYKGSFSIQKGPSVPVSIDLTNPQNIQSVCQALSNSIYAVDKIVAFVNGDPTNYYSEVNLLPRAIITSTLDVASRVLMYNYILDPIPLVRQYLELIDMVLCNIYLWERWELIDPIKAEIREFLRQHPSMTSSFIPFDWLDPFSLMSDPIQDQLSNSGSTHWGLPADFNVFDMNFMQ